MADHSIKGKTVLIAGGAKNLGGLLARDLAEQGAKAVAIHYNTSATKGAADETVAAIQAAGAQAAAFQGDLTSAGAIEKLFADTSPLSASRTSRSTRSVRCSRSPSSRSARPNMTR